MVRETFVAGHPRPKGSLTPQQVRGGGGVLTGRVRMVEASPDSPRWRRTIAKHVERLGWATIDGPCAVSLVFWLPGDPISAEFGDIDKLVRNVLDALDDADVYGDDRQVTTINAGKFRADGPTASGVSIVVWEVPTPHV